MIKKSLLEVLSGPFICILDLRCVWVGIVGFELFLLLFCQLFVVFQLLVMIDLFLEKFEYMFN